MTGLTRGLRHDKAADEILNRFLDCDRNDANPVMQDDGAEFLARE